MLQPDVIPTFTMKYEFGAKGRSWTRIIGIYPLSLTSQSGE
jgi:hypothetical protein